MMSIDVRSSTVSGSRRRQNDSIGRACASMRRHNNNASTIDNENEATRVSDQSDENNALKDNDSIENSPIERFVCREVPLQNADFTLEDRRLFEAALRITQCSLLLNPEKTGHPIEFISDALLDLVQRDRSSVIGNRWDSFIVDDIDEDSDTIDEIVDCLLNRKPVTRVAALRSADDRLNRCVLCFVPIFDQNSDIVTFFVSALKRNDAKDATLSNLQSIESQVIKLLEAVAVTNEADQRLIIQLTSKGLECLTGFAHQEIARSSILNLCGPATTTASKNEIAHAKDSRLMTTTTSLLFSKDGRPFWSAIFSFPLYANPLDATASRCLRVIVDITAKKPEKLGDYILGRTIGNGASGVVRIAKSIRSDEIVAIKIVDATKFRSIAEIELVQDEIGALSAVKHDHIINLHEVIFEDHVFYFVMDFAAGGSLASHMRSMRRAFLNEEDAKDIFRQVVSAVSYCHRRRVIHRDLKPENILLDGNGRVQVADFGLSAIAAPCGSLSNVCGTAEFLAPEVISTTEFDGALADIWSMGVILYELLTGTTPFKGSSRASFFKEIQCGVLTPLPERIGASCQDIVSRMLTKNPQHRISMEEILTHPWTMAEVVGDVAHSGDSDQGSVDKADSTEQSASQLNVHESAKLTIGDWPSGDDAISNAIVSGDYSRSPSIVIVRNNSTEATKKLSDDLEALRESQRRTSSEPHPKSKKTSKHRYVKFFKKQGQS